MASEIFIMSKAPPQAIILAGPNGSGKTTCAQGLLPGAIQFVNADLIAQEMSGVPSQAGDIRAGRMLLERMENIAETRQDFALETTLATLSLRDRVTQIQELGYDVHLLFFWLPSADLSVQRVAERVRLGGHDVPEETIRRRFQKGLRNFFAIYQGAVDLWRMYDNSSWEGPSLLAAGGPKEASVVRNPEQWKQIQEMGGVR
jgi:predicted ABC-type ATPase